MSKRIIFDKKNTVFSLSLAILCLCISFSACKTSIDDMLDDYNSHYTPKEDVPETPGPGDAEFSSVEMLHQSYTITDRESLELYGPPNCKSYNWDIIDPFYEPEPISVPVKYSAGYDNTNRKFSIYVPTSGLKRGVYQIKLTVVGNDNKTYEDKCVLVIYKHIGISD